MKYNFALARISQKYPELAEFLERSMDMEVIEISLEEAHKLQRFGFMSMRHYQEYKDDVVNGLMMFGDEFLKALGGALFHARTDDSLRIMRYWRQDCEQNALLWQCYQAKRKAEAANHG